MNAGKRILIVEDERIVARDIQKSLWELGYDVPHTAATAEHAIRLASERCPDLVLMDIRIKGDRDGIETAELLRERFDVPVVYLTAYADAPTVERAKRTEPLGYLLKPVKPNELRSTVEIALYRNQMEKRLRQRAQWLSTTLRSIGEGVILTNAEARVTYMNPAAEALANERLDQALGRPYGEVLRILPERKAAAPRDPLAEAIRERKTVSGEGRIAHTGGERVVLDTAAPVVDDRGAVLGGVMVFRDVTEQRRLQQQLEHADRLAAIGTMAAGIAHEINNPLAAVIGNVDYARDELRHHEGEGTLPVETLEEVQSALQDAATGSELVRQIVADLKTFCSHHPEKVQSISVRDVIEWALRVAANELRTRAKLVTSLGDVPLVHADPTRLGQVLVNLLSNAAHAIKKADGRAHEVSVATRTDDRGRVVIEVRDTGGGMPPEVLKRAFEPFFTTKDIGEGMGLGLSICHGIVKSLGGEIELESTEGAGTTARVVLPRQDPVPAKGP